MKKSRGAVSIFLVIVLVPCIVISSIFVDASRISLSQAAAKSSADLALNTLLTNYDADLNEWYGMVASCQNIDEFYLISANYFLRTISSQDVSEDEIVLLADYYAAATGDDTIHDLLQIECQTKTSEIVSAVDGANLSNPTFLKTEIVEFMKYRAPIEIASDIFSLFRNEDGTPNDEANALLDNKENEDLVEKKQDYYEAEGELLTAALYSYKAIRKYYDKASEKGYNNDKMIEYAQKLNAYKEDYRSIHNAVVINLMNTDGLAQYSRVTLSLDKYNRTYTSKDVCSGKETNDGVTTYTITGERINGLLEDLESEIKNFNDEMTAFVDSASSLMSNLPGNGDNQANYVQWWVQMNNAVNKGNSSNHKELEKAAEEMLKAYSKVLAIDDCKKTDTEDYSGWEDTRTNLLNEVKMLQGTYLTAGKKDDSDDYLKAVKKLEDVSRDYSSYISADTLMVTVSSGTKSVNKAISDIHSDLDALRTDLNERIKELDTAIGGDGWVGKTKSLDKLADLADKYSKAFNNWSDKADNTDTDMGRSDSNAIAGKGEYVVDQEAKDITRASVTELKTRLVNIRSQLQTLVDAIDSMEYGGRDVYKIENFKDFKQKTDKEVKTKEISLRNREISDYAADTFSDLFEPSGETVVTLSNTTGNSHNPDINPEENNAVETPKLFVYLHKKFKNTGDKVDDKKQDKENSKNAKEEYEEEQEEKLAEKDRDWGDNISREYSAENTSYSASSAISAACELVKAITGGKLSDVRDDVYVTCYIMNMFSYDTYEYEGMYELLKEKDSDAIERLKPTNAVNTYNDKVKGAADQKGTWLSTAVTDDYNKTLTNKMINADNNAAYRAEIEYILYGNTENKDNVKAAYSDIYALRFALNTISAFQHFWSAGKNQTADFIEICANAISAATNYLLPKFVVKAVLLPLLAAVETCMDNSRLSKGMPVELYKSEEDWWYSFNSGTSAGGYADFFSKIKGGEGSGTNKGKGLFYSDYLTFFVYAGLCGGDDVEQNMYKRMAEVIQTNMRKLIGDNSSYSMKKCQLYFKLEATIRVKPLMVSLPIVSQYESSLATETDWRTYQISVVRGYN